MADNPLWHFVSQTLQGPSYCCSSDSLAMSISQAMNDVKTDPYHLFLQSLLVPAVEL